MGNYLDHSTDEAIRALLARKWSHRKVARALGVSRNSVYRRTKSAAPPVLGTQSPASGSECGRKSIIKPYRPLIENQLRSGAITHNEMLLLLRRHEYSGSFTTMRKYVRKLARQHPEWPRRGFSYLSPEHSWMMQFLQGNFSAADLKRDLRDRISTEDAEFLAETVRVGRLGLRNRALIIAGYLKQVSIRSMSSLFKVSRRAANNYVSRFNHGGLAKVFNLRRKEMRKIDDPQNAEAVFKVLHEPPNSCGYGRTTWRMVDLKEELTRRGVRLCAGAIRGIIQKAGFRFRQAKRVLTSNDPDYKAKLREITSILHSLRPDEKFFSVDEFGPFAVKMQGGRSLVGPGEIRTVPQRQKSKGSLIVTAALELSENQVTHFYSERKNTNEMLKLLDLLLAKYADQSCIYFSWDAASWHASKKLYKRVEEINSPEYRATHNGPLVKLAPLPACAQFLNVIESVFSGMARAIIHNSDYPGVSDCKAAIDRYFLERNEHFKAHPKRAGDKIWGKELVPPTFNESNNCKDPRYRGGPH
jgi:transposase